VLVKTGPLNYMSTWGVTKYCSGRQNSAAEDPKQPSALLRRTKH